MPHEMPQEIVALVQRLFEAGCDMWAVKGGYVMNEPSDEPASSVVEAILADFGPRDHLREKISDYLRLIGRDFDLLPP